MRQLLPGEIRINRSAAISMAIHSGNRLHSDGDERHFWALALITFNLFELVGQGESGVDRFVEGYTRITRRQHDEELVLGWHEGCIARALRNLTAHGLSLERTQLKNYDRRERAAVESIGFIPSSQAFDDRALFDVDRIATARYRLRYSPSVCWSFVQEWYEQGLTP